jgi:hypothetical protein
MGWGGDGLLGPEMPFAKSKCLSGELLDPYTVILTPFVDVSMLKS